MLNKVQLIGNLGGDPTIRTTQAGQAVANFSLATNRRWKDREGFPQEETEWHQVVCWGPLAKIAEDHLKKGKQIFVEGRLKTNRWEDDAGVTRFKTEVVAQRILFLGGKPGEGEAPPQEAPDFPPEPPTGDAGEAGEQPRAATA